MHRRIITRMDENKRFTMNLPAGLHKRLKHYCVDHDTEMGEVIRRLVEEFLAKEEKKSKR
jgi:hypothetical protein